MPQLPVVDHDAQTAADRLVQHPVVPLHVDLSEVGGQHRIEQ